MDRDQFLQMLQQLRGERLDWRERASIRRQIITSAPEFRGALCQTLIQEEEQPFKIDLLILIGETGDASYEEQVLAIIQSQGTIEILQTAATTLGKLGGPKALEVLVRLLEHASPNVRYGAILGLAALGDEKAVQYLVHYLDDHAVVKSWWPSPKAGGYTISQEASKAIDTISGHKLLGNRAKIQKWIKKRSAG